MPTEEHNSSDRSSQGFPQGVLTLALMQPVKILASVGAALLMWGLVLAYTANPAHAAAPTICVVTGACHTSLQDAIDAANAGDTIEIGAGEDTEAGIVISKNLTIRGQSATQSFVQAAASPSTATNRVFVINNGVTATLEDLTVRYGYINGNGGGISNNGTLTLQRVTVSQNGTRDASTCGSSGGSCFAADGGEGGGISNNGILSVEQSTISDNTTGKGGDIPLSSACSTFCFGGFGGDGGGISNNGTLSVEQSTISDNTTGKGGDVTVSSACDQSCQARDGGEGGGISNNGILSVEQSTISDNTTGKGGDIPVGSACGDGAGCSAGFGGDGGGISDVGSLTMSNSTLSGNQTGLDGTCNVTDGCFSENNAGFGGGLMVDLVVAHLNNVTITNNRGNGAGGIYHFSGGASVFILTLNNSIVAGNLNTDGQPADCSSVGTGGVRSEGYNLVGTGTGCPSGGTGDLTTSDPKLGVLADNGGPTKTHELLTDSPAIDAGPPTSGDTICPPPSTDQRGVARPQDGNGDSISRCDIGAFELVPNTAPTAVDDSYTTNENTMLTANGAGSNPPGVLANDTDPDSDALQILEVSSPANGTASIDNNGTSADPTDDFVTYTPDADYNGTDTFTYTISDGQGGTDTANVNVTVNPANDTPVANEDSTTWSMIEDAAALSVDLRTLVSDVETTGANLTYTIVSGPDSAKGTLSTTATNGVYSFDSADNFNGQASFTYKVTDRGDPDNCGPAGTSCAAAKESATKTVTITVNPVNDAPTVDVAGGSCGTNDRSGTINLTLSDPEGDAMSLTRVSNTNQTLVPNSNVVLGGTGANRTLTATAVSGRTGTAVLTVRVAEVGGVTGNVVALTVTVDGNGSKTITGTQGADMIFGQNGDDTINAGEGNDLACGGLGNDTLNGEEGNDTLSGGKGNDTLTGGPGADSFSGGLGTDRATDLTQLEGDTTKDNTIP